MVLSHCGCQLFLSAIRHQDNTANKTTGSHTMIPAMSFTWDPSAAQPLRNPVGFWSSARWGVNAAEYGGRTCWFTTHCSFYSVQLAPWHAFARDVQITYWRWDHWNATSRVIICGYVSTSAQVKIKKKCKPPERALWNLKNAFKWCH